MTKNKRVVTSEDFPECPHCGEMQVDTGNNIDQEDWMKVKCEVCDKSYWGSYREEVEVICIY